MEADYASLRGNVSLLGRILGETVASAEGEDFLALIERIRTLSRGARDGDVDDRPAQNPHQLRLGVGRRLKVKAAHGSFPGRIGMVVLNEIDLHAGRLEGAGVIALGKKSPVV